jgi:hypothetical protein
MREVDGGLPDKVGVKRCVARSAANPEVYRPRARPQREGIRPHLAYNPVLTTSYQTIRPYDPKCRNQPKNRSMFAVLIIHRAWASPKH